MAPPSPPNSVDKIGYWGEPTSTLDWCEYNYEVNYYIAEFWNTVSNLCMIVPAILGLYLSVKQDLGVRLHLCYVSLLVVGIGSWLFHMTLLYNMQLMDELPMVWGTLVSSYTLFDINAKDSEVNVPLVLGLVAYGIIVTVVYVLIKIPVFHEVAYGILVVSTFGYSFLLLRRKYFQARWFVISILFIIVGFTVWNLDNTFCTEIRELRQVSPTFLRPFTQLHSWWHFFAGYGTYVSILFVCQARLKAVKRECRIRIGILGLYLDVDEKRDISPEKSPSAYVQVNQSD